MLSEFLLIRLELKAAYEAESWVLTFARIAEFSLIWLELRVTYKEYEY
jgi:hypothetical protein